MYGYELTQKVKELTAGDLVITEGALYPLLHRLEAEGLLDSEIKIVENRQRKYYFLTPKGKKNAPQAASELRSFLQNIQSILQPKTSLG
jgi:DNA-binding PadR family transcriptional regulator